MPLYADGAIDMMKHGAINLYKLLGWALKGLNLFTKSLEFRTKRVTLIDGYCYGTKEIVAPMEYNGYTNNEVYFCLG